MFYFKLAWSNLKKNRRAYLPFLLSMLFLVIVNGLTQLIINNRGMQQLPDSDSAMMMFKSGNVIIIIFTFIFSIYTNSFLLKQRKKELGIYSVLGLGKRELYRLLLWESIISYWVVIVAGIISSLVVTKLAFLILRKMLGAGINFVFTFSGSTLLTLACLFLVIFALLYLINCGHILRLKPVDLLQGTKKGEKEPKSQRFVTLVGILALGIGYYLALRIKSPLDAFAYFFVAVVLVIIGTYALFMAGSITLLNWLKKRPKFYYQTNHFIAVSNMLYRMKQNAAGLASICILSTMVLVTVATTASLYFGQQDMLRSRYPYDISIIAEADNQQVQPIVTDFQKQHQDQITNMTTYRSSQGLLFEKAPNSFQPVTKDSTDMTKMSKAVMISFLGAADYQDVTGKKVTLAEDQVLVFPVSGSFKQKTLQLGKTTFQVKGTLSEFGQYRPAESITDAFLVVTKDEQTFEQLFDQWYQTADYAHYKELQQQFEFDFSEKNAAKRLSLAKELQQQVQPVLAQDDSFDSIDFHRRSNQTFTGGFFFLGIIFGLTFALATALIIYYKQVSEGMDDQLRFEILQKVGMSHQEVKKVINSQVLLVFFFPLVVAIVHLSFAFGLIRKLLLLFGLQNGQLFLVTTGTVVLTFALLYALIYRLTAKTYYQLVERKS